MKQIAAPFFCLIFLLCFTELKSQTDFRPGYVITNENDTLHGYIDYRGSARNAKKCDFKKDEQSETKEFNPGEIKGYRFIDSKYYISKEAGKGYFLFLEFLVNGMADLYYYFDGENSHYFIEKSDGQMFELSNDQEQFSANGHQYVRESKSYIGYLKYAFSDCPQILAKIDNTEFGMKPLVNLTKKYHDYMCNGEKCIIYEKKVPAMRFKLLPFISVNFSSLNFNGLAAYLAAYQNMDFETSVYPALGVKLKVSLPRASEKLSLQFSGEAGKSYYHGSGTLSNGSVFEEDQIRLTSLKARGGIKYTYPKGKIRPTILAGGNILYFMHRDVKRYENSVDGSTVYTNIFSDDIIPNNLLGGYSFEIGADYHSSLKMVPFLNLGFDRSGAVKLASQGHYKIIFQTIHIDAGINF